ASTRCLSGRANSFLNNHYFPRQERHSRFKTPSHQQIRSVDQGLALRDSKPQSNMQLKLNGRAADHEKFNFTKTMTVRPLFISNTCRKHLLNESATQTRHQGTLKNLRMNYARFCLRTSVKKIALVKGRLMHCWRKRPVPL